MIIEHELNLPSSKSCLMGLIEWIVFCFYSRSYYLRMHLFGKGPKSWCSWARFDVGVGVGGAWWRPGSRLDG